MSGLRRHEQELIAAAMTRDLLTAAAGEALIDAARRMAERRVGALLVTDKDELIGIVTERDVLRAVAAGSIGGSVADWMTADPVTIAPGASGGEAAALMMHGGFRHLPVLDGPRLVGIVSIRDLVRLQTESPSGV